MRIKRKSRLISFIFALLLIFSATSSYALEFDAGAIAEQLKTETSTLNMLLLCLLGGFLSCLTPCVYPLIPITLGIFGARDEKSKLKAFSLSVSFVLGIAACFTILGLAAAASGTFFGAALSSPAVTISISIILILLALYTLDLFSLTAITQLQQTANKIGGNGYQGAFLMGCASGVIAAPCIGPVLLTILVVAASAADYLKAALMLFTYALGLGIPFIILGTFSPLIAKIPRSGSWLSIIKYILATCIFAVAVFFAQGIIPEHLLSFISSSKLFITGLILFSILTLVTSVRNNRNYLKAISSATLSIILMTFILNPQIEASNSTGGPITWHPKLSAALQEAEQNNSIAMVDLFAEWCAACKELDIHTFSNSKVKEQLSKFSLGKIDFTNLDDEANAISEKYSVLGLPCILFLDSNGSELPGTRINGFLEPDEFLAHLENKVFNPDSKSSP